ncbi:MAG: hypothetical protein IT364_08675 [Candidatus Hydrogenedentes bacterium]|nr:hypothetical protein [Candidatus Hydrogenedentota bacterium]
MERSNVLLLSGLLLCEALIAQQESAVRLKKAIVPIYPALAVQARVSGEVVATLNIDAAGTVRSVSCTEGNRLLCRLLDRETMSGWLFSPAIGSESRRTIAVKLRFQLMPTGTRAQELTPIFFPPYEVEVRREIPPATVHRDPGPDRSPGDKRR